MARRLYFRSTSTVSTRTRSPRTRWIVSVGLLAATAIGVALVVSPPRSDGESRFVQRFSKHESHFRALTELIAVESSVNAVGADNVGDFWLFGGIWTASDRRFVAYNRKEMLDATGLSVSHYESYLRLLNQSGAYRVARQNLGGAPLRVTIFLLPESPDRGLVKNLVFAASAAPQPLLSWSAAERSSRTAYVPIGKNWYAEFRRP